jgi:hypothetical protein
MGSGTQQCNVPSQPPWNNRVSKKEITVKLVYDVIENVYDDTTQIRTMTEKARMPT